MPLFYSSEKRVELESTHPSSTLYSMSCVSLRCRVVVPMRPPALVLHRHGLGGHWCVGDDALWQNATPRGLLFQSRWFCTFLYWIGLCLAFLWKVALPLMDLFQIWILQLLWSPQEQTGNGHILPHLPIFFPALSLEITVIWKSSSGVRMLKEPMFLCH